jgi:hypothetical protein
MADQDPGKDFLRLLLHSDAGNNEIQIVFLLNSKE